MKQTALKNGFRGHVSTWQNERTVGGDHVARLTVDADGTSAHDHASEAEALKALANKLRALESQVRAMAVRARRGW
jgi:hypothetical protein